jgi:hypothetical protein
MNIKAKNAHSLKLYFILFYLLFFVKFNSQEFISIETLKSIYPFKKYTLKTNELYGFDKTLDVYNFFISSDNILLVTLLPNLEGQSNWLPVKENEIRDKIMSISKLRDWIDTMPTGYKELSHRKLLDKAGGDYFISYNRIPFTESIMPLSLIIKTLTCVSCEFDFKIVSIIFKLWTHNYLSFKIFSLPSAKINK